MFHCQNSLTYLPLSSPGLIFLSQILTSRKGFDAKLAHICDSHEYGEAVAQKKNGKPGKTPEAKHISPPIMPKDLRLYIANSRRTCFPKLTKRAKDAIISYYVQIRGLSSTAQDKPVGITARQMEGLIRMAEASARQRFSDEITEWDAERAVRIADRCLNSCIYEKSGTYDIDGIAGGMKKGVRDMVISINQIVKTLTTDENPADESTVIKTLVSRGYEEETVMKRIQALLKEGKLMSPRDGKLRAVY